MSYYGPGGWGPGTYQPGYGGGRPGFGGAGSGGNRPGNQPGNTQPFPNSQNPNFSGIPYAPNTWPLGQFPNVSLDVPILITFAVIFFIAAVCHFIGMFVNAAIGHKILTSALLFLFCAVRVAALSTRAAGAYLGFNGDLYISGYVLTFGGTPLLYFVNLIFAHRVMRLQHPIIGRWNPVLYIFFIFIYFLMFLAWAFLIAGLVQPFYWQEDWIRNVDRSFRIFAFSFFAIVACLPLPLVIISSLIPRIRRRKRYSHVGMAFKIIIFLVATTLTAAEAVFLAVVEWKPLIPRTNPAPRWTSRAWYYVMVFVIEIIVVFLYLIARVDQRISGAHYPDHHDRRNSRDSRDSRDRSPSPGYMRGSDEKPKKRLFGLLPAKSSKNDSYPISGSPRSPRMQPRDEGREEKKSRFGGLGKLALGLGAGAAAGAATAGAVQHHKRKKNKDRDQSKSVAWEDELEKEEAINRDLGYTNRNLGRHHENKTFNLPRKELRPYDTETILEETEDDTDDSLFAPSSSMRTDSKPMSPASTVVEPDRDRLRPKSAMRDYGNRERSADRSRSRRRMSL